MVVRMYLCRKHINKTSSLLTHSPQQIPPWQLIKRDVCVELMPETVDPTDRPHGCSGASLPGGGSSAKRSGVGKRCGGKESGLDWTYFTSNIYLPIRLQHTYIRSLPKRQPDKSVVLRQFYPCRYRLLLGSWRSRMKKNPICWWMVFQRLCDWQCALSTKRWLNCSLVFAAVLTAVWEDKC